MKKQSARRIVLPGVLCAALLAGAAWYAVAFNEARLVVPMDLSEYRFRMQDLPMLLAILLSILYILFLFALLIRAIGANRRREATARMSRTVNPRLGFLGLLGFLGFAGFWTYSVDRTVFPFLFFMFFGFFGFFYEGKLSNTLMDERYRENRLKAQMTANRVSLFLIFLSMLLIGQGRLMGNLDYTLIALVIVISLAFALDIFLSEYLLYRYDHGGLSEESGE